jgi:hypothetical protein
MPHSGAHVMLYLPNRSLPTMSQPKYPCLTLEDCLFMMDQIDACLDILSRAKQQAPTEIGVKSMLTVIRREVAARALEISGATTTHPFRHKAL